MLMFPRSLALIVTTIIFSITETSVASPAVGGLEDSVPGWAWPEPRLLDERSGNKRSVAPNAGVDDLEETRRVKRARLVEEVAARDGAHESRPEDDLEVTRLVERPRLVEGAARGGAHEESADEGDFLGATRVVKRPHLVVGAAARDDEARESESSGAMLASSGSGADEVVNPEEFFGALDVTHKLDLVSDAAEKDGTGVPTPSTLEETVPHDAPLADSAVPSWLLHDSLSAGADHEVVDPEEFWDALEQEPLNVTRRLGLVSDPDAAEKDGTGVPTPSTEKLEETRLLFDAPLADSALSPKSNATLAWHSISGRAQPPGTSSSTTLPPAFSEATTSQEPPASDVTPRANLVRCERFMPLDLDQEHLPLLLLLRYCGRVARPVSPSRAQDDSEIRDEHHDLFQDCLDQEPLDVTRRLGPVVVSDAAEKGVPTPTPFQPFRHDVGTLFPLAEEDPEDIESSTSGSPTTGGSSVSSVPSSLGSSRDSDVESSEPGPSTNFCGLNFLGPRSTEVEDSEYDSSEEEGDERSEDHLDGDGEGSSQTSNAPSDNWDSVSNHSDAVCDISKVFSGKRSLWSTCKNFFSLSPFFSL